METKSKDHTARVIGLDAVRACAILCVLIVHLGARYCPPRTAGEFVILSLGFIGVELFFVLSGFLIGGILLKEAAKEQFTFRHVPQFWIRRWFRTLPNYWWFLLLFTVFTMNTSRKIWALFPFFLQNLYFYDHGMNFFGISWSLCIEEWMYLLLPLVLVLCTRFIRSTQKAAFIAIMIMIGVPTLLRLTTTYGLPCDLWVRHIVAYQLDAIGMGVLLAYIKLYHPPFMARLTKPACLWTGAVVLFALSYWASAAGFFNSLRAYHSPLGFLWMNVLIFTVEAALCILIVAPLSVVKRLPAFTEGVVVRISLWSYSIYLSHTLIIFLVDHYAHYRRSVMLSLIIVLIFLVSALNYTLFEHPFTNLRERFAVRN